MAASLNMSGFVIPRLGANNYTYWAQKVQMLLRRDGLWSCVADPPEDMDDEQNDRALATIVLTLEDRELVHVQGLNSAKECWDALKAIHVRDSVGSQIHLTRKLFRARLPEGGNLLEHLEQMKRMLLDLREKEVVFTEIQEVFIILSSLDPSYDVFVSNLEVLPKADLTMAMVTSRLLEENQKRLDNAQLRGSSSTPSMQPGDVHAADMREPEKAFATRRCFNCGSTKHLVRACKQKQKQKKKGPFQQKTARNAVQLTMTGDQQAQNASSEWLLDSGSSAHCSFVKAIFKNLKNVQNRHVTLADDICTNVEGIGDVFIPTLNCTLKMLYVPTLKHNLLSVGKLAQEGYELNFRNDHCLLRDRNGTCLTIDKKSGLYVMRHETRKTIANVYDNIQPHNNCIHVWHKRLGPACYKSVKKTLKEALPVKLQPCDAYVKCEPCLQSKGKQSPIGKSSHVEVSKRLELVSLDLIGPMRHVSFGGARYILSIQDQYSRFGFCYLLKDEAQTVSEFEAWLAYVERKYELKVKVVQTDNGSEFTCDKFQNILKRHGIVHRRSAPYTPTQNAFIERRGQTLQNMAEAMILDSGLSPRYWGEAILCANYTMNVVFHSGVNAIPYYLWTGRKPNLNFLHAFGAVAWVTTPRVLRRKGDVKAIKLYFLGYQNNRKAYRFGTETGKVYISAHARIDDATGIDLSRNLTVPSQTHFREPGKRLPNNQGINSQSGDLGGSEDLTSDVTETEQGETPMEEEASASGQSKFSPRRSQRATRPPERYSPSVNCLTIPEPSTYEDILECPKPEKGKWLEAVSKELKSLKTMQVYEVVDIPKAARLLGCRWVFKRKRDSNGEIRYKARLVAKGYLQTTSDFDQIFAPTLKFATLRAVLILAAKKRLHLTHVDIETAYLHAPVQHEIYMEIPQGVKGEPGKCWKLSKSLYGLKQSAFEWNRDLTSTLKELGFKQGEADPCLFKKDAQIALVYVDDLLLATPSEEATKELLEALRRKYRLRNLGRVQNYLGLEIRRVDGGYAISQKEKIQTLITQYGMQDCKGTRVPMNLGFDKDQNSSEPFDSSRYRALIGSLLYISQWSRPDIAMAVNYLSKFCHQPTHKHWMAAKGVVRYLKQTMDKALHLVPKGDLVLSAYADANFGNDVETRQSTSGIAIYLAGSLIHWISTRQRNVALSTAESEYCSLSRTCTELEWFKQLVLDLDIKCDRPIVVYEDNQAAITMANSQGVKSRSKHTDIRYKNVKQAVRNGLVELIYCETANNAADCLTKILGPEKHEASCRLFGIQ